MERDGRIPYIGFVGWSGSGKTTLLEALLSEFKRRGLRIAVVKHTHHRNIQTDRQGKDSRRFADAGAVHTTLWAPDRLVHTHRSRDARSLSFVLAGVYDADLILVEGYKGGRYPKIEVVRGAQAASNPDDPLLIPGLDGRLAFVTDMSDLPSAVPTFGFDEVEELADFIENRVMKPFGAKESDGSLAGT
jgi:molybdopterin-guanine dinucleotide biosynthesis protein MobB